MNLVKSDLARFGFRPVWFNAWHHQKEEHLLASLLQAVRTQAAPRWWRPENVLFRARLIWIRGWKRRMSLLFLVLFAAMAWGFELHHDHNAWKQLVDALSSASEQPAKLTNLFGKAVGKDLLSIISIIGVVAATIKGLRAFGVDPAALLTSVSGSAKLSDLGAQISFRERFAAEFNDVTKALGPRSLLIFIDDLDRCRPESVGEVLEAVNFLATAGDCFIIMGM